MKGNNNNRDIYIENKKEDEPTIMTIMMYVD